MKVKHLALFTLLLATIITLSTSTAVSAQILSPDAAEVQVGILLVNVEKVDLAASSFKLDFYLWFRFNPSEIRLNDVKNFEFINGAPTKYEIDATESYLEYRVKGEFFKTFDFTKYPFESQDLRVQLEHKTLSSAELVYVSDTETSGIDAEANVAGWSVANFEIGTAVHSYGDEEFSRFTSTVVLQRPVFSSFFKSVMPIAVITTIALLAFFISPQNFAQRIGLGVTTLLSATAFHLSLLNGIPPTGYLTFADRMMILVYAIFLYNLSVSVYIMRCVDKKRVEEAGNTNKKALKTLPFLILAGVVILIITQVVL